MAQTYDSYHREYYNTPRGRLAKRRGQKNYRDKLRKKWGLSYEKAAVLERAEREANKEAP